MCNLYITKIKGVGVDYVLKAAHVANLRHHLQFDTEVLQLIALDIAQTIKDDKLFVVHFELHMAKCLIMLLQFGCIFDMACPDDHQLSDPRASKHRRLGAVLGKASCSKFVFATTNK